MKVKPISKHVVRKYMSAFVKLTREGNEVLHSDRPELASLYSRDDYSVVIEYLESIGLINIAPFADMPPVITLTETGYGFLEKERDERYRFWMNSIIVPILVSIITAFITVYILPTLGERAQKWLHTPQQRTEQSEPAALPTDGPSGSP